MKTDNHNKVYGPDGPEVEPTLLLQYLIEKSKEISQGNYRGFPLPFRVFGVTVLDPFPELHEEFLKIVSPSEESVNKRAARCEEIFTDALERPQDRESKHHGGEDGEDFPVDRVVANRFAWAARRLGEEMVARKEFRFLPIWMCMTYIGLCGDAEKFQKFEALCLRYPDPEERIEQVIPILWEALRSRMRKNRDYSEQAN
jgi:hypothetical protein